MARIALLRFISIAFFVSILSFFATSRALAFSGAGSGTSGDPYQITTCSQLQEISNAVSAYYKQMQNIDCTGVTFTPLASSSGFSGTLDGQGYTISNITINGGSSSYQALFDHTSAGAVIKNVNLSGGSISTTGDYAASFIGYVDGDTIIQDSSSSMIISASFGAGGFIGTTNGNFTTTITRSSFTGNLTASNAYLGGLIAVMLSGSTTISDSYTTGTYTGTAYVGGLVGYLTGASISTSYSAASITANGSNYAGGLAGVVSGTISNSFSAASVGGSSANKAGIAGSAGTLTNDYFDVYASGQSLCSANSVTCTGVNSGNSDPNYFKDNKSNAPLDVWNFSGVWKRTASYPVFGMDPSDPSASGSSTNHSPSMPSAPGCGDAAPTSAPNLFQIDTSNNKAILYFAPASGSVNYYMISYGYTPGDNRFGVEFPQNQQTGVVAYTINALSPSTTYYFRARAGNGCMPGAWSNELKVKTAKSSENAISYFEYFVQKILAYLPSGL